MIIRERAFGRIVFGRVAIQAATIAVIVAAACSAAAQTGSGAPNALQGFSQNDDKPVQIKAQTFEVRDKENVAIFSGNVHVVQGDTTIRCKSLIVSYRQDSAAAGARAAQPGPGGKSQISKLEAFGGVVVTQKDQTATGERGIYDLVTKTVTLIGNVVVTQGGNVMRGDRMVVDLNTGISRVESGKARGVEMYIDQSKSNGAKPGAPVREAPRLDPLRPAQQN
jgi:lipopolysaccharide export system protein LptA